MCRQARTISFVESGPINKCGINVREPENISRFLYNFIFKTTEMLRDFNFRTFKKLLKKKKLRKIVIDIDSRAVNVEGNQEGAVKGYNPVVTKVINVITF